MWEYSADTKKVFCIQRKFFEQWQALKGEFLVGKPNIAVLGTESLFLVLFLLWTSRKIPDKFKHKHFLIIVKYYVYWTVHHCDS